MISDIRKSLKSSSVKFLLWAVIASMGLGTLTLIFQYAGGSHADSIAVVNGYPVNILEFRRKLLEHQHMIQQIKQAYGPQADMVLKMWNFNRKADEVVFEKLVGEKVLKSLTDALGTHVHEEYAGNKITDQFFVRQHLGDLIPPQVIRNGTLDVATLNYYLQRQGISEKEFEELLNDALLRTFLLNLIEGGLYIPHDVLKERYKGQFIKKKYAYLAVPRSRYSERARKNKVTPDQLEAYYAGHTETYRIPEKRSATVWAFTPDAFGVVIADEALRNEYNKRKHDYIKTPAKVEVQHILFPFTEKNKVEVRAQVQKIRKQADAAPDSFAQLAEKHSESDDKGRTVTLTRADKRKAFAAAAFNLKQGSISGAIETPEGFELIKLIRKQMPEYKPFDEVKDDLTKKLRQEKFGTVFTSNAQRVVTQSRDVPDIFTKFVAQRKGQESTITQKRREESGESSRLFGIKKVGDRTFYHQGDKGYIIQLTGITKSSIPQLAAIKNKVEKAYYEERAQELLEKELTQSFAAIKSGKKTLAQISQTLDVPVEITGWVSFKDPASLKKLRELQFKLPDISRLTKQGALEKGLTDKHGYLIQVKQMDSYQEKNFQEKESEIRDELRRQELQGLAAGFIQALRDRAQVKINTQLRRQAARL